jgi:phospholipid-binding lipoprotein MlaA
MSNLVMAAAALLSGTAVSPHPLPEMGGSIQAAEIQPEKLSQTSITLAQSTTIETRVTTPVVENGTPPPANQTPTDPIPGVPMTPGTEPVDPNASAVASPEAVTAPENEAGVIVVTGRAGAPPGDPAEVVNEVSFVAVQAVDGAIIAPITRGYDKAAPGAAKKGLYNLLNNLNEPIVFLNFLLQLKLGKAAQTAGRFAINSTMGLGGLMEVAKKEPFKLPRRSNGFADTLGYYGIGSGPYLFLPVIGSTSVRDLIGRVVDLAVLPVGIGKPFSDPLVSLGKGTASSLDDRLRNDEILTRVQHSDRPYAAMREYYLKKRAAQIDVIKGKRCNALLGLDELDLIHKGDLGAPSAPPRKSDGIRIILPAHRPSCADGASPIAP